MLNDIVEKQLSEICRKCKLFDIDVTDCTTKDSLDDSSDFYCLSYDNEQKGGLKKKKAKKDTFFSVISRWRIVHHQKGRCEDFDYYRSL